MLTVTVVGKAVTVTAVVVLAQFGAVELVNVKVELPVATPVTTPALVTVALVASLLAQVPPVVGDKVVVPPLSQIEEAPVMLTVGKAVTVTALVVLAQLGAVELVKVNVGLPAATPVTAPALVIVANYYYYLSRFPLWLGTKWLFLRWHR